MTRDEVFHTRSSPLVAAFGVRAGGNPWSAPAASAYFRGRFIHFSLVLARFAFWPVWGPQSLPCLGLAGAAPGSGGQSSGETRARTARKVASERPSVRARDGRKGAFCAPSSGGHPGLQPESREPNVLNRPNRQKTGPDGAGSPCSSTPNPLFVGRAAHICTKLTLMAATRSRMLV